MKERLDKLEISLPQGFSAGYARAVVNPMEGTGLSGWGNETVRVSTEILDDICVTCTALSDGEKVFLSIYSAGIESDNQICSLPI